MNYLDKKIFIYQYLYFKFTYFFFLIRVINHLLNYCPIWKFWHIKENISKKSITYKDMNFSWKNLKCIPHFILRFIFTLVNINYIYLIIVLKLDEYSCGKLTWNFFTTIFLNHEKNGFIHKTCVEWNIIHYMFGPK